MPKEKEQTGQKNKGKPEGSGKGQQNPVQPKGGQTKLEKKKQAETKQQQVKTGQKKEPAGSVSVPKSYQPRLKKYYRENIVPNLVKKLGYVNSMQAPRLEKICLNQGVHDAITDKRFIENAVSELSLVSGQKAVVTKAKKDISNFKLRKGLPIAVRVTLRGKVMYEFLDRLVSISLPRIRDFRGVNPKSFDGRGNYTLGITEQIIFPEIDLDKITKINGLDITFVTTAKSDLEARALLEEFGVPFRSN